MLGTRYGGTQLCWVLAYPVPVKHFQQAWLRSSVPLMSGPHPMSSVTPPRPMGFNPWMFAQAGMPPPFMYYGAGMSAAMGGPGFHPMSLDRRDFYPPGNHAYFNVAPSPAYPVPPSQPITPPLLPVAREETHSAPPSAGSPPQDDDTNRPPDAPAAPANQPNSRHSRQRQRGDSAGAPLQVSAPAPQPVRRVEKRADVVAADGTDELPSSLPPVMSVMEVKLYACRYCPYAGRAAASVQAHERRHTGEKPFSCSHCSYTAARKAQVTVHERTHTNERPYACTEPGCTMRFKACGALQGHRRVHEKRRSGAGVSSVDNSGEDSGCSTGVGSTGSKKRVRVCGEVASVPFAGVSGVAPDGGPAPPAALSSAHGTVVGGAASSALHIGTAAVGGAAGDRVVHKPLAATAAAGGAAATEILQFPSVPSAVGNVAASGPGTGATSSRGVRRSGAEHVVSSTGALRGAGASVGSGDEASDVKPDRPPAVIKTLCVPLHRCRFCDYKSQFSASMVVHERIHTGDKRFACSHCNYTATRKWQVTVHERTHTNERPYACTTCGMRFKVSSALQAHHRTHDGDTGTGSVPASSAAGTAARPSAAGS